METDDSTNPRFGTEYPNIRIRSNKNAVHCIHAPPGNFELFVDHSLNVFLQYLIAESALIVSCRDDSCDDFVDIEYVFGKRLVCFNAFPDSLAVRISM